MIFAPAPATPLSRWQLAWLAALVVLAQVPLWTHLRLWIVIAGSGLVALRIALPADRPPPARLRRWLLPLLALAVGLGIRWDFGYFLARDPCVAFLYVLVSIKFVEAKSPRDGGLLDLPQRKDNSVAAYLELHVEQGPVLESAGVRLGCCTVRPKAPSARQRSHAAQLCCSQRSPK